MRKFDEHKYLNKGNNVTFYRDGDAFFPELVKSIRRAKREIFIETFILENDRVGQLLLTALLRAAVRGVAISITVDSYGSYFLPRSFVKKLTTAGIAFQIFEPQPRWITGRPKLLRRLHRKLCVIDGHIAFIGGINLVEDHLTKNSTLGMRDYTAKVDGRAALDMRALCCSMLPEESKIKFPGVDSRDNTKDDGEGVDVYFVHRDNKKFRSEIEKAYIHRIDQAKSKVVIANAYFFPSNRFIRALKRATKRHVDVTIVIQGKPDIPASLYLARSLYKTLCRSGVKVYEYTARPYHGKIAVFDDDWSTIGSSNLDPWSLGLNLESNIFIQSQCHQDQVNNFIDELIENSEMISFQRLQRRSLLEVVCYTLIYHIMRWWPRVVSWVPGESLCVRQLRKKSSKSLSQRSVLAHWRSILANEDVEFANKDKRI